MPEPNFTIEQQQGRVPDPPLFLFRRETPSCHPGVASPCKNPSPSTSPAMTRFL